MKKIWLITSKSILEIIYVNSELKTKLPVGTLRNSDDGESKLQEKLIP